MAERGPAGNVAGAITGDAAVVDAEGFGRSDHGARIARWGGRGNLPSPSRSIFSPPAEREGSGEGMSANDMQAASTGPPLTPPASGRGMTGALTHAMRWQ